MITVSLLVLLTVVAVGMLVLSAITLRSTTQGTAQSQAQANARLALMLAIGELQKEMGPDMRVSGESALFDSNKDTDTIEGVEQSHWLASYNSWGDWLNGSYTPPEGGGALKISDTYAPRREKMFRRWLLSMPTGEEKDASAPNSLSGWNNSNSVVLVGPNTLGPAATSHPDQVTRAYLAPVGTVGKYAWWIGPENHKAKIGLTGQPRTLDAAQWQESQGDTAEVGVGALAGFDVLDSQSDLGRKLITTNSLRPAKVDKDKVDAHFFDLTASSQGVVASVRGGSLKKDLSLLFEKGNSQLPVPYKFNVGKDIREPSIRPMSAELAAKMPTIPNRQFASWTNMRHYYRMYQKNSDATIGQIPGAGNLKWSGSNPSTDVVMTNDLGVTNAWDGSNNYWRMPILAKITFIYSLLTEQKTAKTATKEATYECFHVYSPVFTYWNPYNVELRIPDKKITMSTSAYRTLPNSGQFFLGDTLNKNSDDLGAFGTFGYGKEQINAFSVLSSGSSGVDIVFKPGEFRVFSHENNITNKLEAAAPSLVPGFRPGAISGEKKSYGIYTESQRPGLTIEFTHGLWGGNINLGNTAGSLCYQSYWDRDAFAGAVPTTYANDWFQKAQSITPMTPTGLSNVNRWVFTDNKPVPVAFCQLVMKGLSKFEYESIKPSNPPPYNWAKDWRSRNWIHSPPFYFGSGMYISEDNTIAHTQRLDCPYVMFFGPTSMSEMPKVVGQIGNSSFLGSGSNPFEKVTSAPMLELPNAPISSLAGFANMRINPGWLKADQLGSHLSTNTYGGNGWTSTGKESLYAAETKRVAYQSGVTGPGIGNSFMHPMLPRDDVYRFIDNSWSEDVPDRSPGKWMNTNRNNSKAYNDYWDHVFLLNDVLWDDYYVSSLADQTRPTTSAARNLSQNIDQLVANKDLSNSRYRYYDAGKTTNDVKTELQSADGYLKAAKYLMVDGMFNVNSTSVAAWQALFAGIRERQLVFRNSSGGLQKIDVPQDKRIALSRFDTEISDKETDDLSNGAVLPDRSPGWTGVRYLDDEQLLNLAQECVKQVKQRGPFLNFSEFINRRLSNDKLGLMGALQSAIDYDDDAPDSKSLNYKFKKASAYMIKPSELDINSFATPEAVNGSRFAGVPGYIIQSDLLKPIANTLAVRDDTFRIRAYGQANDAGGRVIARAYCEAVVQRLPEYCDTTNESDVPSRLLSTDGRFTDNGALTAQNRMFGRKFRITDFRWLGSNEI